MSETRAEARDRERIAEINRLGEGVYILKTTLQLVGLVVALDAVWTLYDGWENSRRFDIHHTALGTAGFFYVGVLTVIVGAIAASRRITRLREKYPDPSL